MLMISSVQIIFILLTHYHTIHHTILPYYLSAHTFAVADLIRITRRLSYRISGISAISAKILYESLRVNERGGIRFSELNPVCDSNHAQTLV